MPSFMTLGLRDEGKGPFVVHISELAYQARMALAWRDVPLSLNPGKMRLVHHAPVSNSSISKRFQV